MTFFGLFCSVIVLGVAGAAVMIGALHLIEMAERVVLSLWDEAWRQ